MRTRIYPVSEERQSRARCSKPPRHKKGDGAASPLSCVFKRRKDSARPSHESSEMPNRLLRGHVLELASGFPAQAAAIGRLCAGKLDDPGLAQRATKLGGFEKGRVPFFFAHKLFRLLIWISAEATLFDKIFGTLDLAKRCKRGGCAGSCGPCFRFASAQAET